MSTRPELYLPLSTLIHPQSSHSVVVFWVQLPGLNWSLWATGRAGSSPEKR